MRRVIRKLLRAVAEYDPAYYDMAEDPEEACFAQLYLARIRARAQAAGIRPPAAALDAGCQTGRLLVPLAREGYQVTGIDRSRFGLARARRHLRSAGLRAELLRGDLGAVLGRAPERRFQLVICLEVLYLCADYRQLLKRLVDATQPGGLLCVSHRSAYYYQQEALRQHDAGATERALREREGPMLGGNYYNWQTLAELRALYGALPLEEVAFYPIDRQAWLQRLRPSTLPPEEYARWLETELAPATAEEALRARYTLVIGQKTGGNRTR